jgi:hypothetical protein
MRLFGKLKTIKRKWIYLIIAIVIIALAGGIAAKIVCERHEGKNDEKGINSYQTYYDLLYLENTDNLKILPAQAKVLLPLVQKLATADEATQQDLVNNIYKQLSPQQYYSILNEGNKTDIGNGNERFGNNKREFGGKFGRGDRNEKSNNQSDPLKDIVLNMLKDKSSR